MVLEEKSYCGGENAGQASEPGYRQYRMHYSHHENLPMQYTGIFLALKIENQFQLKNFDIFLIFAQNIDCGYTLEPPRRGGSNE